LSFVALLYADVAIKTPPAGVPAGEPAPATITFYSSEVAPAGRASECFLFFNK